MISKNTAIAFVGDLRQMKNFYSELVHLSKFYNGKLTPETIKSFMGNYLPEEFEKAACLILNASEDPNGTLVVNRFIVGKWMEDHSVYLDDIVIAGSGKRSFLEQVSAEVFFNSEAENKKTFNNFIKNICTIAELLAKEWSNLETIENLWGAAYEMILHTEQGFEKLDDIAYLISMSVYKPGGNNAIPTPKILLYHKYYDNILVITAVLLGNSVVSYVDGQTLITCEEHNVKYFPVGTILNEPLANLESQMQKSFKTNQVAIAYFLTLPDQTNFHPIFYNPNTDLIVQFEFQKGLSITMNSNILDLINQNNANSFAASVNAGIIKTTL